MSKKHYIIPIFVPHRGCPNDCVFCNQKKITGLKTEITRNDIENIVNDYVKTIPRKDSTLEIAFYGGSFTGIDLEVQKELLECAKSYKEKKIIDKIRLSTRPDYINIEILNLLKDNSVDIVELGVQSLDEEVLLKSNRGHTISHVYGAVELLRKFRFTMGLQMMVGLVCDTKDKSIETAKRIIKLEPDFVRIYPTLVIKDTYLEQLFITKEYTPFSINKSVDICSDLLMMFNHYNIPVIRLGLQPTENISLSKDVVGGPFHPSFRQLVESRIILLALERFFGNNKFITKDINIYVNKRNISNLVGNKSTNLIHLKSKFGFNKIKVIGKNIPYYHILIGDNKEINEININEFIEKHVTENKLLI